MKMSPQKMAAGQFGDTTYTKVFVGGLAWETQREAMSKYFEQFGEILEAVVITDKNTGRSKGYGFVTFREPEAATRACVDPSPFIDGRRANCNLASLGVQKSAPTTPPSGGKKSFMMMKSFQAAGLQSGMGTAFPSATALPYYAVHQGIPYNVYGSSPHSPEYAYATNYYNMYGGAAAQYPVYGGGAGVVTGANAFYPYFQFGHGSAAFGHGSGYGMQYPQMFQYSAVTSTAGMAGFSPHYGGSIPFALNIPPAQAGRTLAIPAPTLPATAVHYRLVPSYFAMPAYPEKSLA